MSEKISIEYHTGWDRLDAYQMERLANDLNAGNGGCMRHWVLDGTDCFMSILFVDGTIRGWAAVTENCPYWFFLGPIVGVFVEEEFRGNGYGEKLVEDVLLRCREKLTHNTVSVFSKMYLRYEGILRRCGCIPRDITEYRA